MTLALTDFLAYENPTVIHYYSYHRKLSLEDVQQKFKDLLAWFWLSEHRLNQGKKTYLFGPLLQLDDLWHTFILHTRDYVAFGLQFFGTYYHHDVETPGKEYELNEEDLRDLLNDCFENLGEEWVGRCFSELI